MWRQNHFLVDGDSDQSISDDGYDEKDEFKRVTVDSSCTGKLQSLLSAARKKEKEKVQKAKNVREGDLRMGNFLDEGHELIQCSSRNKHYVVAMEESISDENDAAPSNSFSTSEVTSSHNHLHSSKSGRWYAIVEEANNLLHEDPRSAPAFANRSDIKRRRRVGKSKEKPKFSINSQMQSKENLSLRMDEVVELDADSEETKEQNFQHRNINHSMTELLDVFSRRDAATRTTANLVSPNKNAGQSIFTHLEKLVERDGGLQQAPKMKKNDKKAETTRQRTSSYLGNRALVDEKSIEYEDNKISSDDEDQGTDQNKLDIVTGLTGETKGKAMVDLFQEAFSTVALDSGWPPFRQSGLGYHGRLQKIIQIEKDNHVDFLKQLQRGEIPHDESRCIDVQILSRLLDAKLTVCHCTLARKFEGLYGRKTDDRSSFKEDKTFIFQSKICDNVELEVGNMIRVYPPWKEVPVTKDEVVILCTYFSQVVS